MHIQHRPNPSVRAYLTESLGCLFASSTIVAKHTLHDYLTEDYRPWADRPQGQQSGGSRGYKDFLFSRKWHTKA